MKALKYRAKPVVIDGIRFASGREGDRYRTLNLMLTTDIKADAPAHVPG